MIRVLFTLLFLISMGPLPSQAEVQCPTAKILSGLFGVQPNQIQWKVDLRSSCPISDQGNMGSCWANSGIEVYNQWLHKAGEFEPNENLSFDYYIAKRIWEGALEGYVAEGAIVPSEGYSVVKFQKYLFDTGVVYESDFKFPKIDGKSIRESGELHELFYAALNKAKEKKDDALYKEVLETFLGKLGEVPAYEFPEEIKLGFVEKTYNVDEILKSGIPKIESEITETLDRGVPVSFGIGSFGNRLHSAKNSSHIFSGKSNPLLDGTSGHAMNIIGYHLNSSGKVDWYLIQNSWGSEFGTGGTATVSAEYLYRQTHGYAIPQVK